MSRIVASSMDEPVTLLSSLLVYQNGAANNKCDSRDLPLLNLFLLIPNWKWRGGLSLFVVKNNLFYHLALICLGH